ncbi:MAG: helix-turn-helix transcriptional regulator [Geothrix sp.]|uniref:Helix-turn-helix transcriptional regulator n=1 Tax=Candidatus Geothrix odensensis TaxID=2954440 RepID=A0A936F2J9_9BACT|nr:helix-turn-helix transcriptional regulator [Candidatus Geothrix odensensis]MCC6513989.1 helix-turn-helix transcriptional regulator [Geothrix sp.]
MVKRTVGLPTCSPKAPLAERPLLDMRLASELAGLFEVLASETRLRLLHALVLLGDPCMSDLAEAVGMKPQAVSNQLRRLVDLGILDTRRHGIHIHYRIVDHCVIRLMHHGLCLNEETQDHVRVHAS